MRLFLLLAMAVGLALGACDETGDAATGTREAPPTSSVEPAGPGRDAVASADTGSAARSAPVVRAPRLEDGVVVVGVEEVRARLESGEPVLLVDARGRGDFEQERIPGAISVPLPKIAAAGALPRVPRDREIVVYCSTETCPTSRQAVQALLELGYTNAKDMRAGLVGWKRAGFETVSGPSRGS